MCLEDTDNLSFVNIDHLNFSIRATNGNEFAIFIKANGESDGIPSVNLAHLADHPDIPYLDNAIRVTTRYKLPTN